MGLFGWGNKKPRNTEHFSFRIDNVFRIKGHGVVVTGQVTAGEIRTGAGVTCVTGAGERFSCRIQKIEQPDPNDRGHYVHPDRAGADGPFQGSYAFWIADRQAEDFHSGDRLISENG